MHSVSVDLYVPDFSLRGLARFSNGSPLLRTRITQPTFSLIPYLESLLSLRCRPVCPSRLSFTRLIPAVSPSPRPFWRPLVPASRPALVAELCSPFCPPTALLLPSPCLRPTPRPTCPPSTRPRPTTPTRSSRRRSRNPPNCRLTPPSLRPTPQSRPRTPNQPSPAAPAWTSPHPPTESDQDQA